MMRFNKGQGIVDFGENFLWCLLPAQASISNIKPNAPVLSAAQSSFNTPHWYMRLSLTDGHRPIS